ncbi:MAG TPA: YfhO family protein, partial [Thermoanaerobaculia bacterium]
ATAPRWSLVVSSIPMWPGWKVERNGVKIEPIRVNGAFLGFAVPPGTSYVRVYYSPWTWWVGLGLAVVGVFVLALLAVYAARRRGISGAAMQDAPLA